MFVAVAGVVFACDVHYVVALVDALWQGAVAAADLHVAPIDGEGEDVHLPSGVIDVVFVVHVVAVGAQDVGQGRAVGGAAAVADVQGPGGVGGDEFEQDFLRVFCLVAAVGGAFAHDGFEYGAVAAARQADVDETGAGDFDGGDAGMRG